MRVSTILTLDRLDCDATFQLRKRQNLVSKILILDHLTPRMQELYGTAKSFKTRFGFQFCWAKNGTIFLRKSENSRPLKVRSPDDLSRIIQDEQEALS